MRIAFMGTPEFAVPSLRALLNAGYEVVGAFTQPDRPSGRGNHTVPGPVKSLAVERGVPVYQFEKIRRKEGVEALRTLAPDLCVTAAFGQILSQKILDIPHLGTLNVHASLLPRHRGAAPINWSIAMGDRVTGVTIMFTDSGLDTGDIALTRDTEIGAEETAGQLTERLSCLGAELLLEAVGLVEKGVCPRLPQDTQQSTYEPMLTKEMAKIDWSRSAADIACMVRGFNPWPGAYAMLGGMVIKVWSAHAVESVVDGHPGEVVRSDPKAGLVVACGEGALEINCMQVPGAKQMEARAYLRGKPISVGTMFI